MRKQPPGQHPLPFARAHQGHRKQWSGDAVAAVAALIHAVDTLLRRAWKPLCEGGCNLSRAGGPAEARRDGLIPRRRKAQMAQNVSTEDGRQAVAPYGESVRDAKIYSVRLVRMKPGEIPKHRFELMVGLGEPERFSGLGRDDLARAQFAARKFGEGILAIGQDGEPTLQRNTSIILEAVEYLETSTIIDIQFLGTLPEVPMLGPPLREYSLASTPIRRLLRNPALQHPGIANSVP